MDLDYAITLSLQSQNYSNEEFSRQLDSDNEMSMIKLGASTVADYKQGSNSRITPQEASIVDEVWELIDPNPDIHQLFLQFDKEYFWGKLQGIEVRWSPRMTLCAGLCCYEGRGGLCSVRLSLPLLKLRPRKDLVQTLLHEMIHAYLFVTQNNKDHDAHGPEFHKHMYRINKQTGANITVYHTFHDEVNEYRQHWWQCNGPCRQRPPYYGIVRRAMNREPSPRDLWWPEHEKSCGGTYTKIKEPENYKGKGSKGGSASSLGRSGGAKRKPLDDQNTMSKWLKKSDTMDIGRPSTTHSLFPGKGHVLGFAVPTRKMATNKKHQIEAHGSNTAAVHAPCLSQSDRTVNSNICKADPFQKFKHEKQFKDFPFSSVAMVNDNSSEACQLPVGKDEAVDVMHASKLVSLESETVTTEKLGNIMAIAEVKRHEMFACANSNPSSLVSAENLATPPQESMSNTRRGKVNVSGRDPYVSQSHKSDKSNSELNKTDQSRRGFLGSEEDEVEELVDCPSCPRKVPATTINDHLDQCLSFSI